MGQKVNPKGLRIGVIKDWDAKWYSDKNYVELLHEDLKLRKYLKDKLFASGVSNIVIERTGTTKVKINIFTAKPGIVIGRNGAEIEVLRKELEKMTNKQVDVRITEVKRPDVDAQLVAEATAGALERRTAFRRAIDVYKRQAECRATIGQVGNLEHEIINIGKAGRTRWMGIRPTVRGSVMNPNDHPHGGGEGRAPVGRKSPMTPWGKKAFGLKTRKKKNITNKYIVTARKK